LVDQRGNALLADFGLLTILDSGTQSSSGGGSYRWMSPELFEPERFGVEDNRRTKSSDRYALGMVFYEVLSGHVPFPRYGKYAVILKVLRGERPERPQGAEGNWFTDDVWKILESCWQPGPGDRPELQRVWEPWERLKEPSGFGAPSPPLMIEGTQSSSFSELITRESVGGEVVPPTK